MMIKNIRNIIKNIPYIKNIRTERNNSRTVKGSANLVNSTLSSYPPFNFCFYLKVDISFKQKYERSEELLTCIPGLNVTRLVVQSPLPHKVRFAA
jgi:hypothetical protein